MQKQRIHLITWRGTCDCYDKIKNKLYGDAVLHGHAKTSSTSFMLLVSGT